MPPPGESFHGSRGSGVRAADLAPQRVVLIVPLLIIARACSIDSA